MIFNDFIVVLIILFTSCLQLCEAMVNQKLVVYNKGIEDVTPESVALQFFVSLNNTGKHDLEVVLVPDRCCVDVGRKLDCNVIEVVGRSTASIPSGTSKCLKLVAPLLDPFNRKGFCIVFVDSKVTDNRRMMRNNVRIPFDTRLKSLNDSQLPPNIKRCTQKDQDPLNECDPVNCLRYYNGRKSYFNKLVQKCEEVPPCITEVNAEMPQNIYNPVKNKCEDDTPISQEDIAFMKSLVHGERTPKDIVIIKNLKNKVESPTTMKTKNFSDSFMSLNKINDTDYASPISQIILAEKLDPEDPGKWMVSFLMKHRFTYFFVISVVLLQCGLICIMVYLFTQKCLCCQRKKIIRKYFNYRQDVSVTTPLIGTSNIETETTDYQCLSETSNLDKKVQSYKACQRDTVDNLKVSLSDDILSKCLNRRDWRRRTTKEDAIQDYNTKIFTESERKKEKAFIESSNTNVHEPKFTDLKNKQSVDFENEKTKSKDFMKRSKVKNIIKKIEKKTSKTEMSRNKTQHDSDVVYSEQEIKCHSYNNMDDGSTLQRTTNYNITGFRPSQTHDLGFVEVKPGNQTPSSVSTEKSAQVCFPNDSIDDLLSERGMLFLAGDSISRYSFSTNTKSVSSVSSKTSKNNIVKNVLSMLGKKTRNEHLSDPGTRTSKDRFNLEVIHLTQGSAYSSSNESDRIKSYPRKSKDSRTSL